jgi:3-hydroxypropanoate dehydrogenase
VSTVTDFKDLIAPRPALGEDALAKLFDDARTYSGWLPTVLGETTLRALYDHVRWGPTAMNGTPGRFLFVTSPAGKARLLPHIYPMNVAKVSAAPVTVIVARDTRFFEEADTFFPDRAAQIKSMDPTAPMVREIASRGATLQGAYLLLAARAAGLDCGPMSGFNAETLNADFFPDGRLEADFLMNLGRGDPASLMPRNPRLSFEQACQIL